MCATMTLPTTPATLPRRLQLPRVVGKPTTSPATLPRRGQTSHVTYNFATSRTTSPRRGQLSHVKYDAPATNTTRPRRGRFILRAHHDLTDNMSIIIAPQPWVDQLLRDVESATGRTPTCKGFFATEDTDPRNTEAAEVCPSRFLDAA